MYAIIETGGKQYKVKQGDVIDIEMVENDVGESVKFDVLLLCNGENTQVGTPKVAGAVVKGELVGESAGPKIESLVYRRRKGSRRRFGHRQHYSRVKITEIVSK